MRRLLRNDKELMTGETRQQELDMANPSRLFNKDFLLLWQGQTVSTLGTQASTIAMVFWLKHTTDSATLIGLMGMLSSLPAVLLGSVGGACADRFSRRKIIIISDVVDGLVVGSLAALMFFLPGSTRLLVLAALSASVILAIVSAFFGPSISASVPDLVPEHRVPGANSLIQSSFQAASLVGMAVGGTLFRLLGAPILFLIDAISYLFSAGSEYFIRIPQTFPERAGNWRSLAREFRRDTVTGCRFVWNNAGLRILVLGSSVITFFTVPIIVLFPFYIEDVLKVRPDWYGFIMAAYGLGSLLGFVLAGSLNLSGKTRGRVMIAFMLLESIGFGTLGFISSAFVALGLAAGGGCLSSFVLISTTSLLQLRTPAEMRGRVFGLLTTIAGSISPLAMGLAGIVADLLGKNIPLIYMVCGACMVCVSALLPFNREYRKFLEFERALSATTQTSTAAAVVGSDR